MLGIKIVNRLSVFFYVPHVIQTYEFKNKHNVEKSGYCGRRLLRYGKSICTTDDKINDEFLAICKFHLGNLLRLHLAQLLPLHLVFLRIQK
jgi:hypothetical protein